MSPKKGYMEMEGYFYLETHVKCAGLVLFILLTRSINYAINSMIEMFLCGSTWKTELDKQAVAE